MAEAVFLVIGRDPVTGWVRDRIWASRERLLSEGLAFPPGSAAKQRAAVADLVGDTGEAGTTWSHLVRRAAARQETCVLVAAQGLHGADPEVLATVVSSLSPAPVHVLHPVGAPALVTTLAWQDELRCGSTVTFPDFAADERALPDPTTALEPFLELLPPEQLHLVVGATTETLARRTAAVLGVDPDVLDAEDDLLLPPAAAEVLRRFNERLRVRTGELYDDPVLREAVVDSYFVDPAFGPVQGGAQPSLPGVEAWFEAARALAGRLDLVGDLDELAGADAAVDPDDRAVLASGLRHWVRQLEVVERRLDRALELRRLRLAGDTAGDRAGDTAGGSGG